MSSTTKTSRWFSSPTNPRKIRSSCSTWGDSLWKKPSWPARHSRWSVRSSGQSVRRRVPRPASTSSHRDTPCAVPSSSFWQTGETATWLGIPLTESFFAPDGTRIQYFENGILRQNVSGEVEPLPLGSIAAKRAKLDVEPIERPQDVPVYDEELFIPPPDATPVEDANADWSFGPGPQQGAWKEVVVSVSAQTMWAYEEGEMVMSSLVSTGTAEVPETTTPVGYHAVIAKFDAQTMEGTISGEYYRVEDVPYVMYFDNNGNAIHGTYWHSNFGAPMSHGCINLPMDIAAWMYGWADMGTAVSVIS